MHTICCAGAGPAGERLIRSIASRTSKQEESLKRFEKLLASYASARKLQKAGFYMRTLESVLIESIWKYPMYVRLNHKCLVATFGVIAGVIVADAVKRASSKISNDEYGDMLDRERDSLITKSALWVVSLEPSRFMFWESRMSLEEAETAIRNMLRLLEV